MPITFKSKHAPDILMLDSSAMPLLGLLGHSGTVPGAIAAEDVETALRRLETAIAQSPGRVIDQPSAAANANETDNDELDNAAVSLAVRALPLLEMLKVAHREADYVYWER